MSFDCLQPNIKRYVCLIPWYKGTYGDENAEECCQYSNCLKHQTGHICSCSYKFCYSQNLPIYRTYKGIGIYDMQQFGPDYPFILNTTETLKPLKPAEDVKLEQKEDIKPQLPKETAGPNEKTHSADYYFCRYLQCLFSTMPNGKTKKRAQCDMLELLFKAQKLLNDNKSEVFYNCNSA